LAATGLVFAVCSSACASLAARGLSLCAATPTTRPLLPRPATVFRPPAVPALACAARLRDRGITTVTMRRSGLRSISASGGGDANGAVLVTGAGAMGSGAGVRITGPLSLLK
jgi:hypothetical protein